MLQPKDFCYNFWVLKRMFRLPWYPLGFQEEEGGNGARLWIYPKDHWRHKIWRVYKILLVLHCLFMNGRLFRTLFLVMTNAKFVNLDILPNVLVLCLGYACTTYGFMVQFDKRRELNVKIFNEIFCWHSPKQITSQRQSRSPAAAKDKGKDQDTVKTEEVEFSGSENDNIYLLLIIRYFPFTMYFFLCLYPFFYIVHPKLCILLISALNPSQRNFLTVGICLALDLLFQLQFLFGCHYCVLFVLTFIVRFLERIKQQQVQIQKYRNLKGVESRLRSPFFVYKSLRELKLLESLSNLLFSDALFLAKLVGLVGSIGNGYCAIRVIQRKRILGLFYLVFMMNTILGSVGMFDTAYKITSRTEELKQECRLCSQNLVFGIKRRENRIRVRAIPRLGIRIGGFYPVEREATPIFLNYVCTQISSLLITFK